MFDPNADPEALAARAAELALEQLSRLRSRLRINPEAGFEFYKDEFEMHISNTIACQMAAYAVLKGYVTEEQAGL